MIYVYGILYRDLEYAKKSIQSIKEFASEPIHFTVIDSRSYRSSEITKYFKNEIKEGNIDKFLAFKQNVKGEGLTQAYKAFPPDDSEDFFVFTDLDVTVDFDWIAELRNNQAIVRGFSLSLINYVEPNGGHNPDFGFGTWLMGINRWAFENSYLDKFPYVDSLLLHTLQDHGLILRSPKELYHLGWDLWKDYPNSFDEKKKGTNWMSVPNDVDLS